MRFIIIACCISLIASASPAHAQQGPARADDAAVAAAVIQLFAAAERKDLAALDTLYAGEQLTVIEGAGINRGWRDYRDRHIGPELQAFTNFKYRPFEIEPRVHGDFAYAIFRYALQATTAERTIDVVGRGTAILERKGSRWIVRHTQTSSRPRRETDPPMPQ
jgi:ketosteroid isomerase-like protein